MSSVSTMQWSIILSYNNVYFLNCFLLHPRQLSPHCDESLITSYHELVTYTFCDNTYNPVVAVVARYDVLHS